MADIQKVTEGSLAKNNKLNEVIEKLNPLLNIEVNQVDADEPLEIEYSDNNVVLRVPESGLIDGFVETSVTLCQNGTEVTGKILFKAD
jgi:hypothetical protein|tara:strand:- start:3304 stop:3567 length:264 start_codon:yes stop_codon:yes gene_type:complete